MIYLGVDVAFNHSSFAIFNDDKYVKSMNYVVEKIDSDEIKYDKFYEFVKGAIKKYNPNYVICEKAFLGPNRRVFGLISELIGMIRSICLDKNIELIVVATATYRSKLCIPNKKEAAVKLVKSLYPDVIIDKESDISDAICLALYGSKNL